MDKAKKTGEFEMREFFVSDEFPMYVQCWRTQNSDPQRKIVLVHGGAHTGMCWTSTPDERPGWAQHLAQAGWIVYVVDWPGVGRSPRPGNFLTSGPQPILAALAELFRMVGPAKLMGHSIGAAISVKLLEMVPDLVTGFIAWNPAPPAILDEVRPFVPEDEPIRFDEARARQLFANAENFPKQAFRTYLRSLCDLSPSVFNACRTLRQVPDAALRIADSSRILGIPSLVIACDADQLAPEPFSRAVAAFLQCEHVMVGRDWGMPGYGHMTPVETGSEAVLFKAIETLANVGGRRV